MIQYKIVGYAPDADPTTPGVVTDCTMMEPSLRGMKSAPSASGVGLLALDSAAQGAALVTSLDGSKRLLVGTQTALYAAGSSSWTDVTRLTVAYTGGADSRWEFRQFGNVTLASNGVDTPQESSGAAFADLAAMPKAKLMETVAGFVVVANITDAAYQYSDAWWCSALYDYTDWTPAIATQSARARLIDTPGPINALKALGDDLVAFKDRSMYRGRYVGPDVIWAWEPLPGDVGAYSQSSVVSDGSALYWWGGDNFYRFDGSRQEPIGDAVKEWFASTASRSYMYKMQGSYDRENSLIRWYFVSGTDTEPGTCLVYNVITRKWGRADRAIECAVEFVSSSLTYDSAGILAAVTYSSTDWPQSFDSLFWTSAAQTPAVVNSSHTLQTLTGVSASSSLTTGDFGDDARYTLLRRVRVRYADDPDTASMTNYSRRNSGAALSTHDTVSEDDGKFDVLWSDRWHSLKFDWTGNVEMTGFMVDLQPEGER